MKRLAFLISFLMLSTSAFADVSVSVTNAWARATIGTTLISAIYLDIKNNGKEPIELISVSSPSGVASLHESMSHEGMMHMQPLETIKIAPSEILSFTEGHKHIMLENLKSPLKRGDAIKLTLAFKDGSTTIDIPISDKAVSDRTIHHHE